MVYSRFGRNIYFAGETKCALLNHVEEVAILRLRLRLSCGFGLTSRPESGNMPTETMAHDLKEQRFAGHHTPQFSAQSATRVNYYDHVGITWRHSGSEICNWILPSNLQPGKGQIASCVQEKVSQSHS